MKIINKFRLNVPIIFKICILANCSLKAYTNKFHENPVTKTLYTQLRPIISKNLIQKKN